MKTNPTTHKKFNVLGGVVTLGGDVVPSMKDQIDSIRFDYENQAWIVDGRYVRCNHPETMDCKCYGKLHAGEVAK